MYSATLSYDFLVNELRDFFRARNYVEVPVQSRLSILAACEDPFTVSKFTFSGEEWPLPQTGQMWLEHELLTNPDFEGVYCISTSYRNEPNPIPGRHDLIFPMFEFEGRGDMKELAIILYGILEHLKFIKSVEEIGSVKLHRKQVATHKYNHLKILFKTEELTHKHEEQLDDIAAIQYFPRSSNPFWNMKQGENDLFHKIDIILGGIETIGSAEREVDPKIMRANFYSITNGEYAKTMFDKFGKERVMKELNRYLDLPMTPRFGGGIGLTRLIRYFQRRTK